MSAKDVALAGIDLDFAGEVSELAETDQLAGVDDRDLLIQLAVTDEERGHALYLGEELVGEKAGPLDDCFDL